MTICPVAIAVGCQKCPIFKICPAKSMLGDVPKAVPQAVVKSVKKAAPKAARSRKKSG